MKKTNLEEVSKQIAEIQSRLTGKTPPEHFSLKHVASAFLGSLLVGIPFMFRSSLFDVSLALTNERLYLIMLVTIVLLTAEVYFIGYSKIRDKTKRHFAQFWLKRVVTYYGISMIVSFFLVYIYGLNYFAGTFENIFKVVVAVSLPCALGASLADLLGKY